MKEILAVTILGLEKTEHVIVCLFLDCFYNNMIGEILGRNLRYLLGITKDKSFHMLEGLVQKNILKYTTTVNKNSIYIKGGIGYYIFNSNYEEWIPTSNSLFYKLCKLKGLHFNNLSYNYIISRLDLRKALKKSVKDVDKSLTPYELYGIFCKYYKNYFRKEYNPLNQYKDFSTIKKVICRCSYSGIKDSQIKEFVNWCFRVKAKGFKGNFIIGFLPLCLGDYLKLNIVEKINPRYKKDENGRLRLK